MLVPWITCNELGYGNNGNFYTKDRFGAGAGLLFVHGVTCMGTEGRLEDCRLGPVNGTACLPDNTTSFACSGPVTGGCCLVLATCRRLRAARAADAMPAQCSATAPSAAPRSLPNC